MNTDSERGEYRGYGKENKSLILASLNLSLERNPLRDVKVKGQNTGLDIRSLASSGKVDL